MSVSLTRVGQYEVNTRARDQGKIARYAFEEFRCDSECLIVSTKCFMRVFGFQASVLSECFHGVFVFQRDVCQNRRCKFGV